jgi:hypothetical protein
MTDMLILPMCAALPPEVRWLGNVLAPTLWLIAVPVCFFLGLKAGPRWLRVLMILFGHLPGFLLTVLFGDAMGLCAGFVLAPVLYFFADYTGGMVRGAWRGGDGPAEGEPDTDQGG